MCYLFLFLTFKTNHQVLNNLDQPPLYILQNLIMNTLSYQQISNLHQIQANRP